MSNIIFHIGLHKTATTYLQRELFPAVTGIRYTSDSELIKELSSNSLDDEPLLLSYEGLSGIAWNQKWKNGIQNEFHWKTAFFHSITNLKAIFPEAIIIVFFRRHGNLLLSMYKQYIQEGGILRINDFYGESAVIRPEDLDFRYRIDLLEKHFSKVYFLSYEDFKTNPHNFMQILFNDLKPGITIHQIPKPKKVNKSISGSNIELLRRINKPYHRIPLRLRKILRLARISPRDILQKKASKSYDRNPEEFNLLVESIDSDFQKDWMYFESKKWNP